MQKSNRYKRFVNFTLILLFDFTSLTLLADENGFSGSSKLMTSYSSLKTQIASLQINAIRADASCLTRISNSIWSQLNQSEKEDQTVKKTLNLDLRIMLLSKVQAAMNSKFNPQDLPVKPSLPDGLFLSGKKLSRDEEVRLKQKYENSLNEYGEKLNRYRTENELCNIKEDFIQTIIVLGGDAFKYNELEQLLKKYNIDNTTKNRILDGVKIQVQNKSMK